MEMHFQRICERQDDSSMHQKVLLSEMGASLQMLLDRPTHQSVLQITDPEQSSRFESASPRSAAMGASDRSEHRIAEDPDSMVMAEPATFRPEQVAERTGVEQKEICHTREALLSVVGALDPDSPLYKQTFLDLLAYSPAVKVDIEVQRCIEQWMKGSISSNLWIQGPHDAPRFSQSGLISACLVALSEKDDIPYTCYSCHQSSQPRITEIGSSLRTQLISMLRSLTMQLILRLPATFVTDRDLSSCRIEKIFLKKRARRR